MKRPIVVIDAANGVGHGVVLAALDARRPVIAVSPDLEALRSLRLRHPDADLTVLAGSVQDEATSRVLAARLAELDRPIAGIVLAICDTPLRGRVLDQPVDVMHRRVEAELSPQLAAGRQLLPLLAASGRNGGYVVIGSPGSDNPWAGYGHRSIAAAAISMLVRVLHDEARALGVRVQLLAISRPVCTDENRTGACEGWPAARSIGEQAIALIDQVEPRWAGHAVVPFVRGNAARAPVANAATAASETFLAAEPALLAEMISKPAKPMGERGAVTPEGQRTLDQAWALLEPLFSSNRNEANKS